jgi:HEAT repeat protein
MLTLSLGPGLRAQSISSLLSQFESANDNDRITAFYALLNPTPTVRFDAGENTSKLLRDHSRERAIIVQSLIALLGRENVRVRRSFGEEFSNYYGDLIWCVATLHDASSADALLGAVQTGNLATDGLAALGQEALPTLLRALDTTDSGVRNGVLRVLGKLAIPSAKSSLGAPSTAQVRAALLRGIEDEDAFNRQVAIRALEPFADAGVRSAVLSRSTADTSPLVRKAAEDWLRKNP